MVMRNFSEWVTRNSWEQATRNSLECVTRNSWECLSTFLPDFPVNNSWEFPRIFHTIVIWVAVWQSTGKKRICNFEFLFCLFPPPFNLKSFNGFNLIGFNFNVSERINFAGIDLKKYYSQNSNIFISCSSVPVSARCDF